MSGEWRVENGRFTECLCGAETNGRGRDEKRCGRKELFVCRSDCQIVQAFDGVLSKQVLRSGTSIGANVREGQDAQSKADFASKMSIALKECGETLYWLDLLHDTDYITVNQYRSLTDDCIELKKLLTSIVKTSRSRLSPHSPLSTLNSPLS